MADVVIIGGGLGGLSTAMLLALDGHRATVLERDPAPPPPDPDAAWESWNRRGVNQFRMPHLLLPRWRELVERELPDLAACCDRLGAYRYSFLDTRRAAGERRDGDERFDGLTGRRPMIELAVATTAAATSGVAVRRGVGIAGLLHDSDGSGPPHVTGVRTEAGDDLAADLVIDCSGRRSQLPQWLAGVGAAAPAEEHEDSGFVYYARHFRSGDGVMPDGEWQPHVPHGSVATLTMPADNGTWSIAIIAASDDAELRGLRHADRWHAAVARMPESAAWAEAEPLGDVAVMAKLEDRRRRLVVDGEPVATGIVAVGDAWACTNPSLGRGAALGLLHACALRDLLREVAPTDRRGFALRWQEVTDATVGPWYDATVAYDRNRLADMRSARTGATRDADPVWETTKALQKAATVDPDALRAFVSVVSVQELPMPAMMSVPDLFERVGRLAPEIGEPPGADRDELVAAAAGRLTQRVAS